MHCSEVEEAAWEKDLGSDCLDSGTTAPDTHERSRETGPHRRVGSE